MPWYETAMWPFFLVNAVLAGSICIFVITNIAIEYRNATSRSVVDNAVEQFLAIYAVEWPDEVKLQ